jgi:hypothetical protein
MHRVLFGIVIYKLYNRISKPEARIGSRGARGGKKKIQEEGRGGGGD